MRAVLRRAASWVTSAAGAGVLAAGVVVAAAGPAAALPSNCAQNSDLTTVTCTFDYTGGGQLFTVPAGVTSITITADGAQGSASDFPIGGLGGQATATFSVAPGDPVEVVVGGTGDHLGGGGYNGGGGGGSGLGEAGDDGGGGGGASDVRTGTCAAALNCALTARVLVAGGGGGGGDIGNGGGGGHPSGGTGGGAQPGVGGSQTGGGTGGSADTSGCTDAGAGSSSTSAAGGAGGGGSNTANGGVGGDGGGGGGGGYWGGGGGGGSCSIDSDNGGGGGSSWIDTTGTSDAFTNATNSGNGLVTISYTGTATATATTVSAPGTGTTGTAIVPSAVLSGGTNPTGSITFTVIGPQTNAPTNCTSGTSVGSVTVNGNGTYSYSPGYVTTSAGTYWWYASYSGDDQNIVSDSGCGAGMTSTVVSNATTTTVAAPAGGTVGTAIAPTGISATLAGQTSGAGGTITFTVFGPQSSPPSDCTSGGTTVGTAAVSGTTSTYHPSGSGFTPGSAGTYWWYASYGGDDTNVASNSTCGTGMAATVVMDATTTTASDSTTVFSASSQNVTLSATVTSASTVNEGTVTFSVFDSSHNPVGTATGGPVTNGSASVSYGLPAGLAAGTYTIDASYTDPSGNYAGSSEDTATLTVGQATPVITWTTPAPITWGTPLSATQLDATASVPGTFAYTPAAGTVLGPGTGQALKAGFMPVDATDYTTATAQVTVNVVFNPAACITGTVTGPLVIAAGQAYCVHAGAVITNGVTVKPGGALYMTGGTIKGGLTATGATAITVCGVSVSGGLTITGATGPLDIGTCGTNTIAGSVSITKNTGGLTYTGNTVSGSLTITGNTGAVQIVPPNKTTGKVTISGNT